MRSAFFPSDSREGIRLHGDRTMSNDITTSGPHSVYATTASNADDDNILDRPTYVAKALGIHRETLQNWRTRGIGPPFIVLSARKVAYRRSVWRAWLTQRTVSSTSEARETLKEQAQAGTD